MIDPKSLRIGNRYMHKHGKGHTEITVDESLIGKIFSDSDLEYALDDFEPIPLSPSLLERAGFKRIKHDFLDEIWQHNSESLIRFWNYNNEGYVFESYDGHPPIKWFHDLQNLFRDLTGQELELKP